MLLPSLYHLQHSAPANLDKTKLKIFPVGRPPQRTKLLYNPACVFLTQTGFTCKRHHQVQSNMENNQGKIITIFTSSVKIKVFPEKNIF